MYHFPIQFNEILNLHIIKMYNLNICCNKTRDL